MTDSAVDDRWVRRFHTAPDHSPALVCFPHAGGSASYYRWLSDVLRPTVRVFALQYPGRQDRMHDRRLSMIDEFADEVFTALEPLMGQRLAFFGHSMGSVIAFEVATRMVDRRGAGPTTLFVSGRRAPSKHRDDTVHLLDDDGIIDELRRLSGTDVRVLGNEDVLRMVLPPMRSDYTAVENYRYRPGPKLDCPIVALLGDEDSSVDAEEARAWADHTTDSFSLHTFSGGHFYLAEHQKAVADLIVRQLPSPKN
ncbi:thioesterase II family protein [Actinophytocola algeriensis]|uniref:Surfactin synthase thioesterase subunit n=1 Tax=Actinophytocola algeriensis TaxID=1768010 RepID=A0A7W7QBX3_9PSEU|nr:alpha/beta fold hydrolase [Actinophytocola algeriensis]MBB4910653.1 surfactin synthase thioesterase subunit [Actinophytocola algeriensis]MBE1473646.1 surfactin synthase thioesterase subunit [Actinophytocola algeriensis]